MSLSRPVRRKDHVISLEECKNILNSREYCILATVDTEGIPYATPLSYVFLNEKLYFHSASKGHKIDNLETNPRCSIAVVGDTQPVYEKDFTTYLESVVVFGTAEKVDDTTEKVQMLTALAQKYLPGHMDKAEKDITASLARTAVYSIAIEKITGKAKRKK